MKKGTIITLVIAAILIVGLTITGLSAFGYASGLKTQSVRMEQQLSASYEDNQNYLSSFTVSFYEQLGIARERTARGDSILRNAVQGRYGQGGFQAHGQFFSAIVEAYPDINNLVGGYDKVAQHIAAGRETFRGRQSLLRDQLRAYETWQNEGIIRPIIIKSFLHLPTNELKARVGGQIVAVGAAALDQFHKLVLDAQTNQSFTTGQTAPLIGAPASK